MMIPDRRKQLTQGKPQDEKRQAEGDDLIRDVEMLSKLRKSTEIGRCAVGNPQSGDGHYGHTEPFPRSRPILWIHRILGQEIDDEGIILGSLPWIGLVPHFWSDDGRFGHQSP